MKIEKKTYDEREVIEAARVFADPVSPYYDPRDRGQPVRDTSALV
jgi:hypothetical protein